MMAQFINQPALFTAALALAIALTLTACGEKKKNAPAVKQLIHTVTFNDKKIPMTVFYQEVSNEDRSWYVIDSLDFVYDDIKQTVRMPEPVAFYYIEGFDIIKAYDYNFDGYMDISFCMGCNISNYFHDIFLYNPKTKSYSRHEELSKIFNIGVDKEKQIVIETKDEGGGGPCDFDEAKDYKWEKEKLTLIRIEKRDVIEEKNDYNCIRTIKTLQNGKWVQKTDTVSAEDVNTPAPAAAESEGGGTFTDSRDGKKYRTVKIGSQAWMAENLNYKPSSGDSWCYDDNESNCNKYGRLYEWEAAMNACPGGWHLPSKEEWGILIKMAGGENVAGKKLKAKSGWSENGNGTDEFGFLALPGGQRAEDDGFYNISGHGFWWASTDESSELRCFAHHQGLYSGSESMSGTGFSCINGYSVRCVRD